MIEISESNYRRHVEGRNAMGAALQRLVSATEANDAANPNELAEATAQAQAVLAQYGEHQGFAS